MKKLLCLLSMFFVFNASAGILVEPYLNYVATGYEYDMTGVSTEKLVMINTGTLFGARLGLTFGPAFIAADYETGSQKFAVDDAPPPYDQLSSSSDTVTNMGIAVGIDVPVMPLRFYAKMISKATIDKLEGSGTAFGIGLTFLPFVDINIEYRSITYDDVDMGIPLTSAQDIDVKGLAFGISVPFTL